MENLETKKIVLIHGEGFGAWCWYKTIALLEESGMVATALDLTGSGIDLKDTNNVITLEDYSKPLIHYLQTLPEDEKVNIYFYFTFIYREMGLFAFYMTPNMSNGSKVTQRVFECLPLKSPYLKK